jgi:hypothetical protein
MTAFTKLLHRFPCAPALLMTLLIQRSAPVRADDEVENVAVPRPVFILNENAFRQMVYGNLSPEVVRERHARVLALKIAYVDRTCGISRAQRETLELAGKGDIKRHFDRIEEHQNIINRPLEQAEYIKVVQELQVLNRAQSAELFGGESIFAKALRTTLTEDQAAHYRIVQLEKDQGRYQTRVEQYVVGLDNALGLTADQRRRLLHLLLQETHPPRAFGPYDLVFIQYQMSRLPEASLKPIFDDAQWRSLRQKIASGQAVEAMLRGSGYLPDGAPVGFVAQPIAPVAAPAVRIR